MVSVIEDHRAADGVESIGAQWPIAPSTDDEPKVRQVEPARLPPRARRDLELSEAIRRGYEATFQVYGVRKVWRQLGREGIAVARCPVERLMRSLGLEGVGRGKKCRTTGGDDNANRPVARVNRQFTATRPNQLWVAEFTDVATWAGVGYGAFIIEVFARRIIGGRVARSMPAGLVLDALEPALWSRSRTQGVGPHSDQGRQYLSMGYSERLAEGGAVPSMGSVGDSYHNALAETIIGLYKAEVIPRRGPWRHRDAVEYATLEWVDWFNPRRLLEPIGNVPPAELEQAYDRQQEESAIMA